jgi:hypothetical protein
MLKIVDFSSRLRQVFADLELYCVIMISATFPPKDLPNQAIISIASIKPSFKRILVADAQGIPGAHWVSDAIIEAFQGRPGIKDYDNAAIKAAASCREEQSLFDELEIDFVILMEYVQELGLGYVQDARVASVPADTVEVMFALDGSRLCMHALSPDGLTRLYVARNSKHEEVEFRLEFFTQDGDFEKIGSVVVPEAELDEGTRPPMLIWMLSCLTGPLTPPPISV